MSSSTARVIVGQALSIAACGSRLMSHGRHPVTRCQSLCVLTKSEPKVGIDIQFNSLGHILGQALTIAACGSGFHTGVTTCDLMSNLVNH